MRRIMLGASLLAPMLASLLVVFASVLMATGAVVAADEGLFLGLWACAGIPAVLALFAFGAAWLVMLVDVFRQPQMEGTERMVWLVGFLFFNWLGAVAYFYVYIFPDDSAVAG